MLELLAAPPAAAFEQGRIRIQVIGLGAPPPEVCSFQVEGDTLRFSGCTMPALWKRVTR